MARLRKDDQISLFDCSNEENLKDFSEEIREEVFERWSVFNQWDGFIESCQGDRMEWKESTSVENGVFSISTLSVRYSTR